MPLQATRNPEHLSMSRDSNCTKQIRIGEDGLGSPSVAAPQMVGPSQSVPCQNSIREDKSSFVLSENSSRFDQGIFIAVADCVLLKSPKSHKDEQDWYAM